MTDLDGLIRGAADLLRQGRAVVAFTGAGISTPSGIPDFRSPQVGLWANQDLFELASLSAFRYHPERFYEWVRPLAALIYQAKPNAAHLALAALEAAVPLKAVITQNIDELHRRAGTRCLLELHGSLQTATCGRCHRTIPARQCLQRFVEEGIIPRCEQCGSVLKPDVILMEEQLPVAVYQQARQAARQCDVMLVVGSSLEVLPAASLPLEALQSGARLIIVNRATTYLDERADLLIHADVTDALPQIAAEIGAPLA
jgi:NAD-dependent deacetylase